MLTPTKLKELYHYDEVRGIFTKLITTSHNSKKGTNPSCVNNNGYLCVRVLGRLYTQHRLAWLYVHGKFPAGQIDHINGDRQDNRISNLRDVGTLTNNRNRLHNKNNTSGYRGVTFDKANNKWMAQITVDNKNIKLGRFDKPELAYAAYLEAVKSTILKI